MNNQTEKENTMTKEYQLLADSEVIRTYDTLEEAESKLNIAKMGDSTHEFTIEVIDSDG